MPEFRAGHNSGIAGERLKSFVERIEKLEQDREAVNEDVGEVYSEAKGTGFDIKQIRRLVRERKMDAEKRREAEEIYELYKSALGMD